MHLHSCTKGFFDRNCSHNAFLMYQTSQRPFILGWHLSCAAQLFVPIVVWYYMSLYNQHFVRRSQQCCLHLAMSCKITNIYIYPSFSTIWDIGTAYLFALLLTNMVLEFVIGWLFSKAQFTSAFFWGFIYLFIYFCGTTKRIVKFRIFSVFLV
jgi:hypothetical protein